MLNYGGVSAMPPVPTPIPLHTFFAKILFPKSNFATESRTISPRNIAVYSMWCISLTKYSFPPCILWMFVRCVCVLNLMWLTSCQFTHSVPRKWSWIFTSVIPSSFSSHHLHLICCRLWLIATSSRNCSIKLYMILQMVIPIMNQPFENSNK